WREQIEGQVGEAILALFAGDYERVRALITEAQATEAQLPEWSVLAAGLEAVDGEQPVELASPEALAQAKQLLQGSKGDARQPAAVLGVLLAAQTGYYAPYSLEQLNSYTEGERTAWDSYLIAKTLDKGGETLRARNALWDWVQPDSDYFGPAWDLFETLEFKRIGHFDHAAFDALRINKARSLAQHSRDATSASIARCYHNLDGGKAEAAVEDARSAHKADPEAFETNAALALALLESEKSAASFNFWVKACEAAPDAHRARMVTGALKSMERSAEAAGAEILPSVQSGALQTLSSFATDDPRIPLAIARLDLMENAENPALGVARAFRRLDIFLRSIGETGLADLHAGTELDWLQFYLRYGPEQALDLCRDQMERSPGAKSLWLGEVQALRALGRYEEALAAAKEVLKMAPSAPLYEEIALCLQASGSSANQVEEQLRNAQRLGDKLSLNAKLTRAKSLLAVKGERTAGQAISVLAKVWDGENKGPLNHTNSEIGLLISEGLMKRAMNRDFVQAIQLLESVQSRGAGPYDRSLASALRGLCAQMNS
ncbi:MAG: hypothetical protein MK291_13015, partial [Planctomycetes bacterium]|nr:hypothetical protein [Planctomycetota bacterium]